MCLALKMFLIISCGSLKQNWDVKGSCHSWLLCPKYIVRYRHTTYSKLPSTSYHLPTAEYHCK